MKLNLTEKMRWRLGRSVLPHLLDTNRTVQSEKVGSWTVPVAAIGAGSICYSGGVGEEISLETHLVDQHGCEVWAFDPTPRAIRFIEGKCSAEGGLHFLPCGLWSSDTTLHFVPPDNPAHVSYSVGESQPVEDNGFDADCRSIESLMNELGHDHIDLLKLNIEGAEYEVMEAMLDAKIHPRSILVSFEGATPFRSVFLWKRRLQSLGYDLVAFDSWMTTFLHQSAVAGGP